MKFLLQLWRQRQLRIANERYALWKGRHEEWQRQLREGDLSFRMNSYNRHRCINAAGKEAMYLERVDQLLRHP